MNNFLLNAVAEPHTFRNRILNSANRTMAEAGMRGGVRRSACTAQQRNNLYLLADQTVAFEVRGDLVEIGCHEGQTARVLASVIEHHRVDRHLHLYDDFHHSGTNDTNVRTRLEHAFQQTGLPRPKIHEGDLKVTLRTQLPEHIAFAHIDCGVGDFAATDGQSVTHCLEAIYPRMSQGAIGVVMDYHDAERTVVGMDRRPGVKLACDLFFKHRPERIQILYGGTFSHAFFRKVW